MNNSLTVKILAYMSLGVAFGLLLKIPHIANFAITDIVRNFLVLGGKTFLSLVQMVVIPIVIFSIICGICSLEKIDALGRFGLKSFQWFLLITVIAVLLGICGAQFFEIGYGSNFVFLDTVKNIKTDTPSLWKFVGNMIPTNPFKALVEGDMMQIMIFSVLFGIAINISGAYGKRIIQIFSDVNEILIKYILVLMNWAPYGVFCLIAGLFAKQGFGLMQGMLKYFLLMLLLLTFQGGVTYSFILYFSKLSPKIFFKKIYSMMLFAFGVSSSAVSIPVMLDTVENKLGVSKSISTFVIPFGVNFNKGGTAIMLAVATIFISHVYNMPISLSEHFVLIFIVVLVSISTAAVPGIGMFTLVIVLNQFNLPIEGISLVVGIDRLLDMVRTAVNAAGNSMVACLVAQSEGQIDYEVFNSDG